MAKRRKGRMPPALAAYWRKRRGVKRVKNTAPHTGARRRKGKMPAALLAYWRARRRGTSSPTKPKRRQGVRSMRRIPFVPAGALPAVSGVAAGAFLTAIVAKQLGTLQGKAGEFFRGPIGKFGGPVIAGALAAWLLKRYSKTAALAAFGGAIAPAVIALLPKGAGVTGYLPDELAGYLPEALGEGDYEFESEADLEGLGEIAFDENGYAVRVA